ncbi:MAG: translation initiation factor IF-2 [Candidatus Omnitrophica bacterium]|nr:translation initiation factor IF-2 [Candidatus Omnitrophota bacterium]
MVVKKKTEKKEKEAKKAKLLKTTKPLKVAKGPKPAKLAKPTRSQPKVLPPTTEPKPAKIVVKPLPKIKRPQKPVSKKAPKEVVKKIPAVIQPPSAVVQPPPVVSTPPTVEPPKVLEVKMPITVKDLATKLSTKPNDLIKSLMNKKIFVTINQLLEEAVVKEISAEFGYEVKRPPTIEEELLKEHREKVDKAKLVLRAPVVTFMGHVDHGKTSLLDYIRKSNVAEREHGNITQHIGAYEVILDKGRVTFLDTPGHEVFTAMRARGANITDVVVLVVAADDGVMPQTVEAINHAKAASVPIVVAINKCDLPTANIDKVKKQLMQYGLTSEDWGGKTIMIPVSAKTGQGVNELLEMLLLEAELLELKANPNLKARGVVIESHLSEGKGPVATVLVKNGTLRVGDVVLSGLYYGRIRGMLDDRGDRITEAPPSKPVEIMGLSGMPMAGEEFFVVKDEKKARILSLLKQDQKRLARIASQKRITLEDLYAQAKEGRVKELKIILKADVQGSIEALGRALEGLSTDQIKLNIIHGAVGSVNDSDVILAAASNAVIIGFNVKVEEHAHQTAQKEKVEIKIYHIIYEAIADVRAAMEGMLEPISKEVFLGRAIVKQTFRISKIGVIAGCYVQKGTISRQAKIKLIRDRQVVYEGKLGSLKRFKDDVREVAEGFECGIGLAGHDDIKEGDIIEAYIIETVARRL